MTEKFFVDTNVLIYAIDGAAGSKLHVARNLLSKLRNEGRVCVSNQVLCEFVSVSLGKLRVSPAGVSHLLTTFRADTVVLNSPDIISDAVSLSAIAKINFWDALIVESATWVGARTLYTEDLNHGQVIRGVKVVNPFL